MLQRSSSCDRTVDRTVPHAVVLARGCEHAVFAVDELSALGARIRGHLPLACHERIKVLFHLGGLPIAVTATVDEIRESLQPSAMIRFDALPKITKDWIDQWAVGD